MKPAHSPCFEVEFFCNSPRFPEMQAGLASNRPDCQECMWNWLPIALISRNLGRVCFQSPSIQEFHWPDPGMALVNSGVGTSLWLFWTLEQVCDCFELWFSCIRNKSAIDCVFRVGVNKKGVGEDKSGVSPSNPKSFAAKLSLELQRDIHLILILNVSL